MTAYEQFVAAIRHRLAQEGMSVRAVALRAGIPIRSVNSMLEGHIPSVERAVQVAAAVGLEFYIGPPRGTPPPRLDGVMGSTLLRDLEASAKTLNRLVWDAGGNPIPEDMIEARLATLAGERRAPPPPEAASGARPEGTTEAGLRQTDTECPGSSRRTVSSRHEPLSGVLTALGD